MRVVVNAATSADGKLSTRRREQVEISAPADFARVDRLRADSDAVMVGVGTLLADDPGLRVGDPDLRAERRDRGDPAHPAGVVADSRARTPPDAALLEGPGETYVLVAAAAPDDRVRALEERGAVVLAAGEERVDLPAALAGLEERGIDRLMVEGGGELIFSLFEAGLVEELSVFVGPTVIGGRDAPTLADGEGFVAPASFPELSLAGVERLGNGVLVEWTVE